VFFSFWVSSLVSGEPWINDHKLLFKKKSNKINIVVYSI
jgi:hypothetical protein